MVRTIGIATRPAPGLAETLDVSWELFGELCRVLALRVDQDYSPEVIVGIATAGVIPAAVIADLMGADFYGMKITRRAAGDLPELISTAPVQAAGKRVLLVDEITTTGETLRIALASLRDVVPSEIRTATCFCRTAGYRPDYHALETDAQIVFPWDRR
jgi:hypoxanthine phosphoribosyltransferase